MHISRSKWPSKDGKKIHESIWLRESYREGGKVKKRNIANLKNCSPEEIAAIEFALKHKGDLDRLLAIENKELRQGPSFGATFAVFEVAKRLGIIKALTQSHEGNLALWQVIARVIDQGSRLSSVRLVHTLSAPEIIGFEKGFTEDDLYQNLTWLAENQTKIEKRLFKDRHKEKPRLFLYDVTSSYLEGEDNELADYGYNRDKKRGKKQIVIGLLADEAGEPVATQVFTGNTSDLSTFSDQIKKAASEFGCEQVTFVGDKGMIKSGQIEDLVAARFHYITSITKQQIRSLIKAGQFQLELFEDKLCEVEVEGVRYVLRKNPKRALEMRENRASKLAALQTLTDDQNRYLAEHPKADQHVARKKILEKCGRLNMGNFVTITAKDRRIKVEVDEEYMAEVAQLDGCYAIKTDLPAEDADKKTVHDRYKDLAMVETAFRTFKTTHLEVRPVYVRKGANTRGHVLVVMLAYLIVRYLKNAWDTFDLTVEEGIDQLRSLCVLDDGESCYWLPEPNQQTAALLESLNVKLPKLVPKSKICVDTRRKLKNSRKK